MIVKLDETNKLNDICKNQFASQVNKIKSLGGKLVQFKIVTSVKLDKGPNSKDRKLYIYTPFKGNHKQKYKTNVYS